ncbi:DUF6644 family protein [Alteromonas sp. C1M14]|uniref:DUF6644 family protein n=1 Tax=Alteromonas sp. C1M14 TaxID=2841567 RepID=UPI001C0982C3|nr:DUF6644 family protein [Alteromonas sp. C1M14]MBU2977769.1 hypothetical protein [Alteromonas sp. C1M14]
MLDTLTHWMLASSLYQYIQNQMWVWPTLESLHFVGLCLLYGSLLIVDLRLAGLFRGISVANVSRFIPLTLIGFFINLTTGILFIFGDPQRYFINPSFQLKMLCVLLACINAGFLSVLLGRYQSRSNRDAKDTTHLPISIKLSAILSLGLWTAVIVLGRFIPYVE